MPRPPNVVRPVQLCLMLPEDIRGWLDLYLYSEVEGRVPQGAYQAFFLRKIREERSWHRLQIGEAGEFVVGPKEYIATLERRLKHGN